MENRDKIIEVIDLTKEYDGTVIIENVNFTVYRGEIISIVGGSGCGKSTLLRQIIGLEKPTEGQTLIKGADLAHATEDDKNNILKEFGVLFQSTGLFASMTLGQNIALPLETYTKLNKRQIDEIVDIRLASVGLDGYRHYYPVEISGGMKKRAALARAMALDPEVLFFDEPNSGLDPVTAAAMDQLVMELNRGLGTTMIIVTHDLESILNVSHRIVMLDKTVKGVIAIGTPDELKNMKDNPRVYNFFNRIPDMD
ncbi:MAG: ABC transporter ATP-binding protein [Chloroflexota bacterium]